MRKAWTRWGVALVLALVGGTLGCGDDGTGGGSSPMDSGTPPPMDSGPDLSAFLGTYRITGMLTLTPSGGMAQTFSSMDMLTITESSSADIILNDPNCALPADVTGPTSFTVRSTSCTLTPDDPSIMSMTLTLSGSGSVVGSALMVTVNGPLSVVLSDGSTVTGTASWQLSGSKL